MSSRTLHIVNGSSQKTERLRGRKAVAQRERRLRRTNGLCEDCLAEGKITPATVVDHETPLAHGGTDDDENTRNLCDDHNKIRTAEQFGYKQKQEIGLDGWPVTQAPSGSTRTGTDP